MNNVSYHGDLVSQNIPSFYATKISKIGTVETGNFTLCNLSNSMQDFDLCALGQIHFLHEMFLGMAMIEELCLTVFCPLQAQSAAEATRNILKENCFLVNILQFNKWLVFLNIMELLQCFMTSLLSGTNQAQQIHVLDSKETLDLYLESFPCISLAVLTDNRHDMRLLEFGHVVSMPATCQQ